jgi:tetratricopeptide (TPR) repeat protein
LRRRGKMEGQTKGKQDEALKEIAYHYKVLGLNPAADRKRLIKTYKAAIRQWAPDKYSDDSLQWKKALEMTQKIDRAYENILVYMTQPARQRHPYISASTQEPAQQGTFRAKQQPEVPSPSVEITAAFPVLSLHAVKPLTSLPNAAFLVYTCLVLGLTILGHDSFSAGIIPEILGQSIGFIALPLVGCIAFNLVDGEARKMKYVSIALTGVFLLLVFPLETELFEKLLHRDKATLQTETPDAPEKKWINSGNALKSKGKYNMSVKAYSKALEVNPGCSDAYYGRAVAYSKLGMDKEFISDLRDAARLGNLDAIETLNRLDIRY